MTPEEQAAVARLVDLSVWKSGAVNGDYSIAPPYTPAPATVPRDNVPKGRVETFKLPLAQSKFYPPPISAAPRPTARSWYISPPNTRPARPHLCWSRTTRWGRTTGSRLPQDYEATHILDEHDAPTRTACLRCNSRGSSGRVAWRRSMRWCRQVRTVVRGNRRPSSSRPCGGRGSACRRQGLRDATLRLKDAERHGVAATLNGGELCGGAAALASCIGFAVSNPELLSARSRSWNFHGRALTIGFSA